MDKIERKRSSNYTHREKEILLSLVETYIHIIENKKTNAVYNKQKNECWEKLAWEYNSIQTSGLRTGVQLKSCYEQLKKIAKQHQADDKVEILKTGGGVFIPKITTVDEKVMSLLKDNYFSIENKYDNNATLPVCKSIPSMTCSGFNTSTSSMTATVTAGTSTAAENIFIFENEDTLTSNDLEITGQHDDTTNNLEDITNRQSTSVINAKESVPQERSVPERKKRKVVSETSVRQVNKEKQGNDMKVKQIGVLELKMNLLKKMEEAEIENIKGKKLDNEIKEIIKERIGGTQN